jgi:membrane-bound serine protease (ClpP class)
VVSGTPAALLGASGELVEFNSGEGWAMVQGEHWRVRGADSLRPGARVRVAGVRGATLDVIVDAVSTEGA